MVFNEVQNKILGRIKQLSKIKKDLYKGYSITKKPEKGYAELLKEIRRSSGNFFFTITHLETNPRIEISPRQLKVLREEKLILPLEAFSTTKIFKEIVIKEIEKENKRSKEVKTEQEKEYARYLKLKKEFENE